MGDDTPDPVAEPQANIEELPLSGPDRRRFMQVMAADSLSAAGRVYGLGQAIRRSVGAAQTAFISELETIRRASEPPPESYESPDEVGLQPPAIGGGPGSVSPDDPRPADPPSSPSPSSAPVPETPPRQGQQLTSEQDALLRRAIHAIIGANREGFGPQLTLSAFHWDGAAFRISTSRGGLRAENVRRDGRISLHIEDPEAGLYANVEGTARLLEGLEVHKETLPILAKYLPEEEVESEWERLNEGFDRVVILLEPSRILFGRNHGVLEGSRPSRPSRPDS